MKRFYYNKAIRFFSLASGCLTALKYCLPTNIITAILILMVLSFQYVIAQDVTHEGFACVECHSEVPDSKYKHYPAEESCLNCHDQVVTEHPGDEKAFKLYEPAPELCYMCHDPYTSKSNLHMPASEGECLMCHSPHASNNKSLVIEEPVSNICLMCHDMPMQSHVSIHGPVQEGSCQSCHDPHQSDHKALLRSSPSDLCIKCHNKTIRIDEHTVVENIGQKLKNSSVVHPALELDGCSLCHSSHSSEEAFLLQNKYPGGNYTEALPKNFAICFDCHDPSILTKDNLNSTFRDKNTNLHYIHINGLKGRSCSVCHDVHAANNKHLIKEQVNFQQWPMKMNFSFDDNGGSCFPGCHGEKTYER